jgi:hypothetical protein
MTQLSDLPASTAHVLPPAAPDKHNGKGADIATAAIAVPAPDLDKQLKAANERHSQELRLEKMIAAKDGEIVACEGDIAVKKNELKALEDSREKLVNELRGVIRGDGDTLFDGVGTAAQAIRAGLDAAAASKQSDDDAADLAAWNKATLSDIGIKGKLAENLEADGQKNGKALDKWLNQNPRPKIKGVGDTAIDKISDAKLAFFTRVRAERVDARRKLVDEGNSETICKVAARGKKLTIALSPAVENQDWYYSLSIAFGKFKDDRVIQGPHPKRADAIRTAVEVAALLIKQNEKGLDAKALSAAADLTNELAAVSKKLEADEAAGQLTDSTKTDASVVDSVPTTKDSKPHTAQDGNPLGASRGAGVKRALKALIVTLDGVLDQAEIEAPGDHSDRVKLLSHVSGKPIKSGDTFDTTTLGELQEWEHKLREMTVDQVKAIFAKGV